eukprot:15343920-Ditylum_brightwellii.AAC.1
MKLPSCNMPQLCNDILGLTVGATVEEQNEFEWDNFLKGRILTKCGNDQELFIIFSIQTALCPHNNTGKNTLSWLYDTFSLQYGKLATYIYT